MLDPDPTSVQGEPHEETDRSDRRSSSLSDPGGHRRRTHRPSAAEVPLGPGKPLPNDYLAMPQRWG